MESWEGPPPSLDPLEEDIMIGKDKEKVSRSPASNPRLLGPACNPFTLSFILGRRVAPCCCGRWLDEHAVIVIKRFDWSFDM